MKSKITLPLLLATPFLMGGCREKHDYSITVSNKASVGVKVEIFAANLTSDDDPDTVEPLESTTKTFVEDGGANYTVRVTRVEPANSPSESRMVKFVQQTDSASFLVLESINRPSRLLLVKGQFAAIGRETTVLVASTGALSLLFLFGLTLGRAPRRNEKVNDQ